MVRVIGFDADDTLWENMGNFLDVQGRFLALLEPFSPKAPALPHLQETEIRNLRHFGYGVKGFTLSMIETALDVTEGRVTAPAIRTILDLGLEMLTRPVEPLPHARACLEALSGRFDLMLVTKGDLFDQESKLARSGLASHFRWVEVVSEKDAAAYAGLMARNGIAPSEFLMVGNSLKSDVLPALQAGARAVHVPHVHTWFHEEVPEGLLDPRTYTTLANLGDLPAWLDGQTS